MMKKSYVFLVLMQSIFSSVEAVQTEPELVDKAVHATLLIQTELIHGFTMDEDAVGRWRGAGFLVDKENGLVATNAHVAGYGPANIRGRFIRESSYSALTPIFIDSLHDVAILKIDTKLIPSYVQQLELECDYELRRGEPVFAVGHPKSQDFTATKGILSGNKNRHLDGDFYTTDLTSESGNSGGPVIRLEAGKVIGVVTSHFRGSGIGHLTKSRDICPVLHLLQSGKNPARPRLGFQTVISEGEFGAMVVNVIDPKSPLEFMDEVLSWNGQPWRPDRDGDLADQMRGYDRPTVSLEVLRDGVKKIVTVPVSQGRSQHERDWVFFSGITLTNSPHLDAKDLLPPREGNVVTVQSIDKKYDDVLDLEFTKFAEVISLNEVKITSLRQAYSILKKSADKGEKVRIIARDIDYNPEAYMHYFQHSITVEALKSSKAYE